VKILLPLSASISLVLGQPLKMAETRPAVASSQVRPTPADAADPSAFQERDFATRVRRLTFEGLRAGEGYWSPEGTRMVFQSERAPANPFYQV
jgi:hypothetical protein